MADSASGPKKADIRLPGKGNLHLPWHEAGPLNYPDDIADSNQLVVNKEHSLSPGRSEREFLIDNLLVQNHFIIVMIRWTGLAPWEFVVNK